jgi:hypothetical protein
LRDVHADEPGSAGDENRLPHIILASSGTLGPHAENLSMLAPAGGARLGAVRAV